MPVVLSSLEARERVRGAPQASLPPLREGEQEHARKTRVLQLLQGAAGQLTATRPSRLPYDPLMAIPDFQSAMLPLLRFLSDGAARNTAEIRDQLAKHFKLTDDELALRLPSGRQRIFVNRVAWALAYLKRAALVTSPKRASYRITPQGLGALEASPSKIDITFLKQIDTINGGEALNPLPSPDATSTDTPLERLDRAYGELRRATEQELLELARSCSPAFFEQLVVDLLVAMGYGGGDPDAGLTVGGSGDEGIDGVIKEDPLGLDTIYRFGTRSNCCNATSRRRVTVRVDVARQTPRRIDHARESRQSAG